MIPAMWLVQGLKRCIDYSTVIKDLFIRGSYKIPSSDDVTVKYCDSLIDKFNFVGGDEWCTFHFYKWNGAA